MAEPKQSAEGFIDPPGPFDPAEDWAAFLAEMKTLPKSPEVDASIAQAETMLAAIGESLPDDDFRDLGDEEENDDDGEEA